MRSMRVLAASLWILCPVSVAAQEHHPRPVAGGVTDVNTAARTLSLGDEEFFVPAEVSLQGIETGDQVVVHWEERGGRKVAVEIDKSHRED